VSAFAFFRVRSTGASRDRRSILEETIRPRRPSLILATPTSGLTGPSSAPPVEPFAFAVAVVTAACFLCAGVVAWRLRPRERTGALLVTFGVLWSLYQIPLHRYAFPRPAAEAVAVAVGTWPAVLAHLVVAFPTGRLASVSARAVVAFAYLCALTVAVWRAVAPGTGATTAGAVALVALGTAVIGSQAVRLRRGSATTRRAVAPVLAAALVASALLVVGKPAMAAGAAVPYLAPIIQLALAGIPLAYLAGLLRRRIDRGGVAERVVRLGAGSRRGDLQAALARALHDPSLQVGYWVPEAERYVDADGRPLPVPTGPDRAVTRVDRDGPLALLVHDPALLAEPELIETACAAASLALVNERLTAELRARLRQLAESRAEVLRAAEAERRRLERDLHDGVQQRLLAIPMTLTLAETALRSDPGRAEELIGEARRASLAVLDEVRALCQGIHPPVLTERGLAGAVKELAAVAPLPLDVTVECGDGLSPEIETTAYYVVAEGLANLAKHAAAERGRIRVVRDGGRLAVEVGDDGRGGADPERGSGLRGLASRVAANGGVLRVDSPVGHGTTIRAELPCG